MTCFVISRGKVEKWVAVLEPGALLPEGMDVRVESVPEPKGAMGGAQSWGEVFKDLIGAVECLPQDMTENHDHYIHGTPKR